MSSAIYMTFDEPVPVAAWLKFCDAHGIEYSSHTVGENAFYRGGLGGVQITFGEPNFGPTPRKKDGTYDFDQVQPPAQATRIVVSSFWMSNLRGIAETARLISERWSGKHTCDPELNGWDEVTPADPAETNIWAWEWVLIPNYRQHENDQELHEYIAPSGTRYIRITTNALALVLACKSGKPAEVFFGPGLKADAREAVARYEQAAARYEQACRGELA